MGVVAEATSPTPLSSRRVLRLALQHSGAERRRIDCLPDLELPATTVDPVKQCIERIPIPGAIPARNLLVGPDPKLHDVNWTQPDSTRGRQFQIRKAIDTPALRAAVLKCES
jgi:hypothetical protein